MLRINRFLYFGSLRRSSTLIFRIWTCIVLATSDSLVTNMSVLIKNLIVHFLMQNNGQLVYKSMSSFAFTPQSFISDCGVSSLSLMPFIHFTYAVVPDLVLLRVF